MILRVPYGVVNAGTDGKNGVLWHFLGDIGELKASHCFFVECSEQTRALIVIVIEFRLIDERLMKFRDMVLGQDLHQILLVDVVGVIHHLSVVVLYAMIHDVDEELTHSIGIDFAFWSGDWIPRNALEPDFLRWPPAIVGERDEDGIAFAIPHFRLFPIGQLSHFEIQ